MGTMTQRDDSSILKEEFLRQWKQTKVANAHITQARFLIYDLQDHMDEIKNRPIETADVQITDFDLQPDPLAALVTEQHRGIDQPAGGKTVSPVTYNLTAYNEIDGILEKVAAQAENGSNLQACEGNAACGCTHAKLEREVKLLSDRIKLMHGIVGLARECRRQIIYQPEMMLALRKQK